jgi:hypothetical protein
MIDNFFVNFSKRRVEGFHDRSRFDTGSKDINTQYQVHSEIHRHLIYTILNGEYIYGDKTLNMSSIVS